MNKIHIRSISCIAAFVIGLAIYIDNHRAYADSGWEAATRIEQGSYLDIRNVSISSTSGTALFSSTTKRPDGICFNNTANVIWVGSVTANVFLTPHTNILQGFPVVSSGTIHLGGSMTGNLYGTCNSGIGSCEMRCIDGLVR